MAFFELPNVDDVKEDDEIFPYHIDDSLDFLFHHRDEVENLIDNIAENPNSSLLDCPYGIIYNGDPQENIDELEALRNSIEDKIEDFFEWSTSLVVSTRIYNPCASIQAIVFIEEADGKLTAVKYHLIESRVMEFSNPNFPKTLKELQSPEGMNTLAGAYPQDPAYLVTCPSKKAPIEGIIVKSLIDITKELKEEHPVFYEGTPDYTDGADFEFLNLGTLNGGLAKEGEPSQITFPAFDVILGQSSNQTGLN